MRKILLNLEISTKCRAACSMCPRKHVPKNKFIDDDLVNSGLHCKMCPYCYICKKGDFAIDNK